MNKLKLFFYDSRVISWILTVSIVGTFIKFVSFDFEPKAGIVVIVSMLLWYWIKETVESLKELTNPAQSQKETNKCIKGLVPQKGSCLWPND